MADCKFKVGDKVILKGCEFAGIGEIKELSERRVLVHWDHSGSPGAPFDANYLRSEFNVGGFAPAPEPPRASSALDAWVAERKQQQAAAASPVHETRIDELKARIAELEALAHSQLNSLVGLRSELADVKGERGRLREETARLESECYLLKSKLVQAQGKARRSW